MLKLRRDGNPLTSDDLDNNFVFLLTQIEQLRNAFAHQSRTTSGDTSDSFGITVENGKFEFKIPKLEYKGEFDASKSYNVGDFVWHNHAVWFLKNDPLNPGEWKQEDWNCVVQFPENQLGTVCRDKYND